jgi:hypothetical protein
MRASAVPAARTRGERRAPLLPAWRLAAGLACALGPVAACSPAGGAEGSGSPAGLATEAYEWSFAAPLPEERTEVSATSDGVSLFLLGGFAASDAPGQQARAPRGMWRYDPAADSWAPTGDLPEGVNHAGLVHFDGRLYLVGGFREATFSPVAAVRIFDIASGEWSEGAPLPTPRGAMAVAVVNGRIHAVGGNAAGPGAVHEHDAHTLTNDNSVGTHEVYDPATDSWERRAPMPTARNHHGAVGLSGRLHGVGGRADGDFEMTTHEVYDPTTDSWSAGAPLPTGRSGIAVVERDGRLYVFGGETFGQNARTFDDAERFDPVTGVWARLPPMPTARHGLGAARLGDWIHVVSGGPQPGFAFGSMHERLGPAQPN